MNKSKRGKHLRYDLNSTANIALYYDCYRFSLSSTPQRQAGKGPSPDATNDFALYFAMHECHADYLDYVRKE